MKNNQSRRGFMSLAAAGSVGFLLVPKSGFGRLHSILETHKFEEVFDCDPETMQITPNNLFYILGRKPRSFPAIEDYRLQISGLVNVAMAYKYEEIKAFPSITLRDTLECVSNSVGGSSIGNAEWTGTKFSNIMDAVGVEIEARYALFHAMDPIGTSNYTTYHPISAINRENVILAWEMNGEELPVDHGWPLRFICPNYYGYKNPKWLNEIEFLENITNATGHYESGGWDKEGFNLTMSKFSHDYGDSVITGETTLCGVANSPNKGIKKVQVSLDNGASWQDAEITYRGATTAEWVLWKYPWTPSQDGIHFLVVRAVHNDDSIQTSVKNDGYPAGSTGWHTLEVEVDLDVTPVEENDTITPNAFKLDQNYPNPFNSQTKIRYTIPHSSNASVIIYNILGEQVKVLVQGNHSAGSYNITWDGTNSGGRKIASGIYLVRLTAGAFSETKKMSFVG